MVIAIALFFKVQPANSPKLELVGGVYFGHGCSSGWLRISCDRVLIASFCYDPYIKS
jgi:hypothetical protein